MSQLILHIVFGISCMFVSHTALTEFPNVPGSILYNNSFVKDNALMLSFTACEGAALIYEYVIDPAPDDRGFERSQAGIIPMVIFYKIDF